MSSTMPVLGRVFLKFRLLLCLGRNRRWEGGRRLQIDRELGEESKQHTNTTASLWKATISAQSNESRSPWSVAHRFEMAGLQETVRFEIRFDEYRRLRPQRSTPDLQVSLSCTYTCVYTCTAQTHWQSKSHVCLCCMKGESVKIFISLIYITASEAFWNAFLNLRVSVKRHASSRFG